MEFIYVSLVKDFVGYSQSILDFYNPHYTIPYTEDTLNNSAVICFAMHGDKIIGAVRAVSDLSRHALIVDLIVNNDFQRQGIGSELVRMIVKELKNKGVKNVNLGMDPRFPWLYNFYVKLGFTPCEAGQYFSI